MSADRETGCGLMRSRKTNKGKQVSHRCRNNGTCLTCIGNRTHAARKQELSAMEKERDYELLRLLQTGVRLEAYGDTNTSKNAKDQEKAEEDVGGRMTGQCVRPGFPQRSRTTL